MQRPTQRKTRTAQQPPAVPPLSDADRMLRGLPLESGEAQPAPKPTRPLH